MTVDILAAVVAHLRDEIPGVQIGTRHPSSFDDAWVTVHLLDDAVETIAYHVRRADLQLDCYAGEGETEIDAIDLAHTVRGAIAGLQHATHAGLVITGVLRLSSRPLPDTEFREPRDRVIVTVQLAYHPA